MLTGLTSETGQSRHFDRAPDRLPVFADKQTCQSRLAGLKGANIGRCRCGPGRPVLVRCPADHRGTIELAFGLLRLINDQSSSGTTLIHEFRDR